LEPFYYGSFYLNRATRPKLRSPDISSVTKDEYGKIPIVMSPTSDNE